MTALHAFLSGPLALRIGWVLLHFLWQGAVIALALAIALHILRRRTPQARWLASCLALSAMLAAPLVTACLVPSEEQVRAATFAATESPFIATERVGPGPVLPGPHQSLALGSSTIAPPPEPSTLSAARNSIPEPSASWQQQARDFLWPALPWIALLWTVGVLGMGLWHLGGWVQTLRMKRRKTQPVPEVVRQCLARLGRQ